MKSRIRLLGVSRPPVWRRLLLAEDTRLDRLHEVIQAAIGWSHCHLHVFSAGLEEYGVPDDEMGVGDERDVTLRELLLRAGGRARYTYDFGDDWEHELVLEKALKADPGTTYPLCSAGKGACPPEDCGGPEGYRHLRGVLGDPADSEHEDMLEWLGLGSASEFDPAHFDADEVNDVLASWRRALTEGRSPSGGRGGGRLAVGPGPRDQP